MFKRLMRGLGLAAAGWLALTSVCATTVIAPAASAKPPSKPVPLAGKGTVGQARAGVQAGRPELVLQIGHSAMVTCVAFSPDGKLLASSSADKTIILWDAHSGSFKQTLRGHTDQVFGLAYAPDGKTLASGSWDKTIKLWEAPAGKLKRTLTGHDDRLMSVAFSPDGHTLASASADRTVKLWDLTTGTVKRTLTGFPYWAFAVAFSPDGKLLACGSGELNKPGEVKVWDLQGGRWLNSWPEANSVTGVAFSPDGKWIASSSGKLTTFGEGGKSTPFGEVKIRSARTGEIKHAFASDRQIAVATLFSPDGVSVIGGFGGPFADDSAIRVYDLQTGALKKEMKVLLATNVIRVTVSRDGQTLASAGYDKSVTLWDARSGEKKRTLAGHSDGVLAVAVSPDGNTIARGSTDYTVTLWDRHTGVLQRTLRGHTDPVCSVKFSPDGNLLASIGTFGSIRFWDLRTSNCTFAPVHAPGTQGGAAFSPDGRWLTVGGGLGLYVLDAQTGAPRLAGVGEGNVFGIALSPDGSTLACGHGIAERGEVRICEAATRKVLHAMKTPARVNAVAFSPDGETVVSGEGTIGASEVRVWDARTGALRRSLPGHRDGVFAVAFSHNGRLIASGGYREIRLWDAVTGVLQRSISPQDRVGSLAFTPNDKALVCGSDDSTTRLWDVATGRLLATLLTLPAAELNAQVAGARPIEVGSKPIELGSKGGASASSEWFVTTPEGYFDCSANAARFIRWDLNGTLYPAERYLRRFRRPDLVRKALQGLPIAEPALSTSDVPPAIYAVRLQQDAAAPGALRVSVDTVDDREVKSLDLFVNNRPLPPDQARPIEVGAKPIELGAKPIELGAKPIELGAKPIELGAKPIELGAKPIELGSKPIELGSKQAAPQHRVMKRFTFRIRPPQGRDEVRLRVNAYDDSDLGADPVEFVLTQAAAAPVTGHLFVLSAGVSRYQHADGKGFRNLQFPAIDAQGISDRFKQEGKPLYDKVEARTLLNEQATIANLRDGLRWLQSSVRPGQIDTVVLFLSGHGVSIDGKYYYATHDLELSNIAGTSLPGRELREALGGKLTAKAVFLFVDTCHSGGLTGRNDDLAIEMSDGVYLLASSGAKEYSFEAKEWGHGAFTLALLRALNKQELARDGVIHFNALTYAVPDEVAALMKEAGRNENEQEPCIPLAARRLRAPLAQAAR